MKEEARIGWTEESSEIYRQLAAVAVPARGEEIATVLALLPFGREQSFRVVDLACGDGPLTYAVLEAFPNARALALDGSLTMCSYARTHLSGFGERAEVRTFDLASSAWYPHLEGAGCAISSLCVHHLQGSEKRQLFAAVYERLASPGALILADIIEPQRSEGREVFGGQWDLSAREQSVTGHAPELYAQFVDRGWNHYRTPCPRDHPSGLFEQLQWMHEAGFEAVDCFWLVAGHAIYGGYKGPASAGQQSLSYDAARESARKALGAVAAACPGVNR